MPPEIIQKIQKELLSLRPNDILTKNKLARVATLDLDSAEKILIELYKEKYLQIVIRVNCNGEEYEHFVWFNSLKDYYSAPKDFICNECGSSYDWKNAKVGFKRGIYR